MSRGIDRERAVKRKLQQDSWIVIRAAGSLGTFDLVALKQGETPRLIEVKSDDDNYGPWSNFKPEQRAKLSWAAAFAGAEAWLAYWPKHGQLQWIPEHEWPKRPLVALPSITVP